MKKVLLFDTSEGSDNIGDNIIMYYCEKILLELFDYEMFWFDKVPTHLEIGKTTFKLNKEAIYSFVCGTNILKTSILKKKLWKIGFNEAFNLRNLILMGIGWGNYNKFDTDPYTKWVYKSILSDKFLHSVRDNYTKCQLNKIGINNVINTACPTMWNLSSEHCSQIPSKKSKEVVTSLTYYKPDIQRDRYMFHILKENYDRIYLWIQQSNDYDYFLSLNINFHVDIIGPQLIKYERLLSTHDIDFIGSRLHGGIHALNYKKRTLIIGVDNRAKEINRDTNLPFIDRNSIESLDSWVKGNAKTEIILPYDNIKEWKSQFRGKT